MLSASELRIGNYLLFQHDHHSEKIQSVTATDIVDIEFSNADGYAPVILSRDILTRASFQASSETDLEFILDPQNKLVATPFIDGGYVVQLCCQTNWSGQKPRYLHQLQNLFFALSGNELLVDL